MSKPFLIDGPDGERFEIASDRVAYFTDYYLPRGFRIVDPAPTGYGVPELPVAVKDEKPGIVVNGVNLSAMRRTDLDSFAAEHGVVDADKLPNKDAVIEAIVLAVGPAVTD